ncbi:MAG TPA: hypothetical protein PKA64_22830 [Myxococcota bacterium]|nr:hypothetical protein [Myxococcota bacterium]
MARGHTIGLLLLTACKGIPETEFIAGYERLYCDGYALCASEEAKRVVYERECLEYMRYEPYPEPPDCKFDREAAEACITDFAGMGCVGTDPEIPLICADVYSQCALPRLPSEGDPAAEAEAN